MKSTSTYRADIEGLRAIAVLLVVLFHVDKSWSPGGFVGVDVFFVISGFLITGIIVRDLDAGTFSNREFYSRRIRRIIPAMLVVTAVTCVASAILLLPDDLVDLGWSAVATVLSAANIYFTLFLDTSYFAPQSDAQPLLHMWSLGVEEQFYLLWPAFLALLFRWRSRLAALLCGVVVASLLCSVALLHFGQFSWAYYMLPSRAFQLALGGLVFVLMYRKVQAWSGVMATLAAACGLALVIGSAFLLSEADAYPGLNAIPVTLGTGLLLASGTCQQPVARLLGFGPLRFVGKISYSMYLWHWPVLAFQRYYSPDLSLQQKLASVCVIVLLAWLSYRFVEQPFRYGARPFRWTLQRYLVVPGAAISALAAFLILSSGVPPWISEERLARIENPVAPAFSFPFVCQASEITKDLASSADCVLGEADRPSVLLYGDSNAAHYVGAMRVIAEANGLTFRNLAHSSCPPINSDPTPFVYARYREPCIASLEVAEEVLSEYQTVVIGAAWAAYDAVDSRAFREQVAAQVDRLAAAGKSVVLLGLIPPQPRFDRACLAKRALLPLVDCEQVRVREQVPEINVVLEEIASKYPHVWYLDPYPALCRNQRCLAYDSETPLYYDAGHLSMSGSEKVGQLWLRQIREQSIEPLVGGGTGQLPD
ncbi:MAG: acyltransferase family protein [Neoaquamicrobium sediminum]|uniref:acyltransferase family protein n=1 Tax=Neoaquamicrobium sediminum TaxID=1849104 RepID=UPI0040364D6A